VAAFGVVPSLHWMIIHGGLYSIHVLVLSSLLVQLMPLFQNWIPNVVILYVLAGLAFVFYVSMMPERWLPGTFDLIGSSHQLWHLLILAALAWWQRAGVQLLSHHRLDQRACLDHR
jgi:predicted membrane channel-forming protein YqfA (hemolysin III family)